MNLFGTSARVGCEINAFAHNVLRKENEKKKKKKINGDCVRISAA